MDEQKKRKESERKTKYDKENSEVIAMRLMFKGDADILDHLNGAKAMGVKRQTELKRLIRAGMETEKNIQK